jgi:hypothetical protein
VQVLKLCEVAGLMKLGHVALDGTKIKANEFIRRFLLHVLPKGFHRIRHYGLLATGTRAENIERAKELLGIETPDTAKTEATAGDTPPDDTSGAELPPCPCCGARLRIIETFLRAHTPTHRPSPCPVVFKVDTS